jgi:hypothetical protein
VDKKKK